MTKALRRLSLVLCGVVALAALGGAPTSLADDLSLSVLPAAPLGPFVPGLAADYTTTAVATVTAPTDATLTIADASGVGVPGVLYNTAAAASLDTPLEAAGSSSAAGAAGSALAPIGADPLALVTYSLPVTDDPVTIELLQAIDATEPLSTGAYTKTLTLTLTEGP